MIDCEPPYHRLDCTGGCELAQLVELVRSVADDPTASYAPRRTLVMRRIYAVTRGINGRI